MTCPACGHANRPGAKFCEECGAAFAAANAQRPSDPSGARKVVSIVFADLVGSTALHERLDPESARRFMESYYTAMRGAVESHGRGPYATSRTRWAKNGICAHDAPLFAVAGRT